MWLTQGSASESTIALVTGKVANLFISAGARIISRGTIRPSPTDAGVPASSRRGPEKLVEPSEGYVMSPTADLRGFANKRTAMVEAEIGREAPNDPI
jgi:hypothetical protein